MEKLLILLVLMSPIIMMPHSMVKYRRVSALASERVPFTGLKIDFVLNDLSTYKKKDHFHLILTLS